MMDKSGINSVIQFTEGRQMDVVERVAVACR